MKTKKIAVYSLTFVLFSLMMLAYWLPKVKTWSPYTSGIDTLLIFLLARVGGNVALIFIDKKISSSIVAGIMAIILFILLLIRSEVLAEFILLFYAPITTLIMVYSLFRKRGPNFSKNFFKAFTAGISACAFYWLVLFMTGKSNPGLSIGGDGGGGVWIAIAIGISIGCMQIIMLIVSYAFQKDAAQVGNKE